MNKNPNSNVDESKDAQASSKLGLSSTLGRHRRKIALSNLELNVPRSSTEGPSAQTSQHSKIDDEREMDQKPTLSEALNLKITISRNGKREIVESPALHNKNFADETSLSSDASANMSNVESSNERETSNDELKHEVEPEKHKKKLIGKIHRDIKAQHKSQDPFTFSNALTSTCTSDSEAKDTVEKCLQHKTINSSRGRKIVKNFSTKEAVFELSALGAEKSNTEQNTSSNKTLQLSTSIESNILQRDILNELGSNDSNPYNSDQNTVINSDLGATLKENISSNKQLPDLTPEKIIQKTMGRGYLFNKFLSTCDSSSREITYTEPSCIDNEKNSASKHDSEDRSSLLNSGNLNILKCFGRGRKICSPEKKVPDSIKLQLNRPSSSTSTENESLANEIGHENVQDICQERLKDNCSKDLFMESSYLDNKEKVFPKSDFKDESSCKFTNKEIIPEDKSDIFSSGNFSIIKSFGRGRKIHSLENKVPDYVAKNESHSSETGHENVVDFCQEEIMYPNSSNEVKLIVKGIGRGKLPSILKLDYLSNTKTDFKESQAFSKNNDSDKESKIDKVIDQEVSSVCENFGKATPTSDDPEDTSSILNNKTNLTLLKPESLLGRVLCKIANRTTEEQTVASKEPKHSDKKFESTICEDFSKNKTDAGKKTNTSHSNIQESKSFEKTGEHFSKIVNETYSVDNELAKVSEDIIEEEQNDENLGNISFDSSGSSLSENLLPGTKYIEDGSTSTSDLNKYSDDDSISSYKQLSSEYYNDETKSKLQTTGSIIHGDVPINMVSKVNDLQVHNLIMKNLEYRRITDLTRCQMVSIPIVAEERNLVLIGPPATKKTSAWLIPVLNNLLNDEQLEPKKSPKCIIIVPGSNSVRYIARLCSAYVGAKLTTIGTHGGGLELERKDELLTGVDILISTPRCCLRLFNSKYVISSDRLRYFVIDNAHDVLKRFSQEMNLLKSGLDYLTHVREKFNEDSRLQTILVSTMWTKEIENIALNWMKMPVICMTSYLEAAIYSRMNINLHIVKKNDKVTKLFDMVCSNNIIRTVIVCNSPEETKQLRAKLSTLPRRVVLVAHEEMLQTLLPGVQDAWNNADSVPLLICTNFATSDLNISNAKWLIHYSVPINKPDFRDRFKFVKDFFIDRIKNKHIEKPICKADIFIDESTEHLFPKMIEILDRLNQPVTDEWRSHVKEIEKSIEMEKDKALFCENIFQFGQCWKMRCKQRHVIKPSKDAPKLEPAIKSFVTLHILEVISPTHLIVRLKYHSRKLFSDKIELKSNYVYIALKLAEFYAVKDNRCTPGRTSIGDVVGVAIKDSFARAKVVEIMRDEKSNAIEVSLYLLDKGIYLSEKPENLLSLPIELRGLPGEAVNVYITGLVPLDLDHCWSYTATKFISKKIMELQYDESRNIMIMGQVELVIGTSLLLDKLLFYEEPPKGCTSPWLIESLGQLIISSNFGILNPGHKIILSKLAEEAGIETPKDLCKIDVLPKKKQKEECRWAHLLMDEEYFVNIIVAEDIGTFFVRPFKFQECLNNLEKDLNDRMKIKPVILEEFIVGTVCAVKVPNEDKFNRGIIVEPSESLRDSEVEVLFVDHGDRIVFEKSELFELPEGYIARLPFQAIECGLAGIDPILSEEISNVAVNRLYALTSNKYIYSPIFLKVIRCARKTVFTGGSHYDVVLIDKNNDKFILINEEMVNLGFAHWNNEMKDLILSFKKREKRKPESKLPIECKTNSSDEQLSVATIPSSSSTAEINDSTFEIMNEQFDTNNFEIVGNFFEEVLKNMFPSLQLNKAQLDEENISKDSSVIIKEIDSEREENLETNNNSDHITQHLPLEDLSDYDELTDNNLCTLKRISVYSPTVHWRQSPTYVWIKILLPDVKKFKLFWSMSYVNFHTMIDEKLYWVDIDLFGSINPDKVMHKVTGLYFEVRLTKLLTGYSWPRIFYTNMKLRNVIHDPDKVSLDEDDEKEDLSLIPSYVERSEEMSKQKSTVSKKINKLYSKFNFHALEDNSASSGESDIDDFIPVPEAVENLFED